MEHVDCAICDVDDTKRLLIKNGYNLVKCNRCGLVYINPRPTEAELVRFYSFDNYHKSHHIRPNYEAQEKLFRKYRYRLGLIERFVRGGKILDVGCSVGSFLTVAKAAGWQTYGTEMNEDIAIYAQTNYGLDVSVGKLESLNFPTAYFDIVTLFDSLEHMLDPLGTLREVHRILRADGLVVITTPNINGLLPRVTYLLFGKSLGAWEHPTPPAHTYQFSVRTLLRLLEKANFDRIKTISEQIAMKYTAGKLENALIDSLQKRENPKAESAVPLAVPSFQFPPKSFLPPSRGRFHLVKKIPRLTIRLICYGLICSIYPLAKLTQRSDSMLVIARKKKALN